MKIYWQSVNNDNLRYLFFDVVLKKTKHYFCREMIAWITIFNAKSDINRLFINFATDMKHKKVDILTQDGNYVSAQAPVIVSASRATDIPAFYADWFFNRLRCGYVKWRNPFNGVDSYISFANTRFVVFWSKNPQPLLPYLHELKELGIGCYIQFTLNDYDDEGLEPNLPGLDERIETFKQIVEQLGEGSVVWRFDPLILTDKITIDSLLVKIKNIGDRLHGYTEKLVFSFADIVTYPRVRMNLLRAGVKYKEWNEMQINLLAG